MNFFDFMMIMTFWWSKATRLLEFSRSSVNRTLRPEKRDTFCVRYIPSEKIGQNIDPLRKSFFVTNYLHWTGTSVLQPFLGPPDPWGGLGGHGGVLGGLPPPKMPLCHRDQFKPWNGLFWLMITGYTIFLRFRVKMGLSGPKKGHFGPK